MIKEVIDRILKERLVIQTEVAQVVSVDETNMTCEVSITGKPNLTDVRLKSVIDSVDKGILVKPTIESYVLVSLINNKKGNAFVSGFTEVDSIRLITDSIELSGDSFGGLIKIEELKKELNKNNQILISLLSVINGAPIPTAPVTSPSSLQLAFKGVLVGKQIADFSNIENNKVKHG